MNYRKAIKVFWRGSRLDRDGNLIREPSSPYHLGLRARAFIEKKCRRYPDRARRHTITCC